MGGRVTSERTHPDGALDAAVGRRDLSRAVAHRLIRDDGAELRVDVVW